MADKKPIDFIPLVNAQVTLDLDFFTQSDGSGLLTAGDYKGKISQIVLLLESIGYLKIIPGTHVDDAAAIAAGGVTGNGYKLAINNAYNIPVGNGGVIKIIE